MIIRIANVDTGEIVEWNPKLWELNETGKPSRVIGAIRGQIRQWIKNGLSPLNFEVLIAHGHDFLNDYLHDYAMDVWLDQEDIFDLDDLEDFDDDLLHNC